jgi:cytoskeletal protein CcmA (bactofilin family)
MIVKAGLDGFSYNRRLMAPLGQPEATPAISDNRPELTASSRAVPEDGVRSVGPAVISKGVFIKGEITGSESLVVDGKVEGSINLNGNRVTVGIDGQVAANITAREVIVMGKVRGNVTATDRVDIRADGALTGDVAAARISIEDGAFFRGGIEIRKSRESSELLHRAVAIEGSPLADSYDARAEESIFQGRYRTLEDEGDLEEVLPKWKSAQPAFLPSRARVETH